MRNRSIALILCTTMFLLSGCGTEHEFAGRESAQKEAAYEAEDEETGKAEDEENEDTAVQEEAEVTSRDVFAMDTYMTLTAYGSHGEEAVTQGIRKIKALDQLLSTGDEQSEIYGLNQKKSGILSEDSGSLVERALELYEETDGCFDIAIYPVMKVWGFPTQEYRVPDEDSLEEALQLADASKILYDSETREISFADSGMEIDLGGIAKGYTSAAIMDIYRSCGVTSGLVNLGGNVQALGTKPDGSKWRIAIQSPDDENEYLGILEIADQAVITSGGYERYFEENGQSYHHIIDPATGYPAENGLVSVTIVSSDGTLADGLSTSLFIMGLERAAEFWKAHQEEFEVIMETEDEILYVSAGIADSLYTDLDVVMIEG